MRANDLRYQVLTSSCEMRASSDETHEVKAGAIAILHAVPRSARIS
jgi:hypothetical protein